jgi:hypothetical protein
MYIHILHKSIYRAGKTNIAMLTFLQLVKQNIEDGMLDMCVYNKYLFRVKGVKGLFGYIYIYIYIYI